jgi:CMP-N-acetylneuraminic acid synthetase
VPFKNIAPLAGRPLLAYVIAAAREALGRSVDTVICSTDDDNIAAYAESQQVSVLRRPPELADDAALVADAVRHVLHSLAEREGAAPGIVVLFQPTSPFILPAHVDGLVGSLKATPGFDTAQTIAPIPHNFHAYNQRIVEGDKVRFFFEAERRKARNKQSKPKLFRFGNLLAFRSEGVLSGGDCFGHSSTYLEIPESYALDVDGPRDFALAEYMIAHGEVELPQNLPGATDDIRPL